MSNITNAAVSGLQASEQRIATAANNIAIADVPGGHAQDVSLTPIGGGVSAKAVDRTPATITSISADGEPEQLPNVSIDQELITAQSAKNDFAASAQVLKTQNDLTKTLLDVVA